MASLFFDFLPRGLRNARRAFGAALLASVACSSAPSNDAASTTEPLGLPPCKPPKVLQCQITTPDGCVGPMICVDPNQKTKPPPTCGVLGLACCTAPLSTTPSKCTDNWTSCVAGACAMCGDQGQPLCPAATPPNDTACYPGLMDNGSGVCSTCPEERNDCDGRCSPGLTFNRGRNVCVPCGAPGLLTCNGACEAGAVVVGNRCMSPTAAKMPELVVMCTAKDLPGVIVGPIGSIDLPSTSANDAARPAEPIATARETTSLPRMFGVAGSGTDDLFDYFAEMTYGRFDRSGTQIRGWFPLEKTQAELEALNRGARVDACVAAAQAADPSLDPAQFKDIVAMFNYYGDGGNQGGSNKVTTNPWGIFTSFMAHEIVHALGQPLHSQQEGCTDASGNPTDYCDPWDEMSANVNWATGSAVYWAPAYVGGPAKSSANSLVAANRIILGKALGVDMFLPSEIFTPQVGTSRNVTLAAVNRPEVKGTRVATIPFTGPSGDARYYTVELMRNTGWDSGDLSTGVLIHSVNAAGQVTLIPSLGAASGGQAPALNGSWKAGKTFSRGSVSVSVVSIDPVSSTAVVTITD